MANAELPFFDPSGERPANGREDGDSHAAIAAAFAAFRRGTGPRRRRSYLAAGGRFLRGTGGAILGLIIAAFAGGLFLAHMPTSSPDHPITIGSFAPEMIYKRPATAEGALVTEREGARVEQADDAVAASRAARAPSTEEAAARVSTRESGDGAAELIATASLAQNSLPETTANFAAAMRFNAIGGVQNSGSGSAVTDGFAAEELPSVPEPAAGPAIAVGLATLLGLQRFLRRRRTIP